jgi:hypothetical protein
MSFILVSLALSILLGLIPANIAKEKGREFGLWWLYGAAIFICRANSRATDEADYRGR